MLRLFVGIGLPPPLKLRLGVLCGGVPGARWVDPGNFHLTLRFIGEVDEGQAGDIDQTLAQVRALRFELRLAGVGQFGMRMLWVGVDKSPPLLQLKDKVDRALMRAGLGPDDRRFAPHVTLARLNQPAPTKLQAFLSTHALFRAEPLAVVHFSLVASYPTKSGAIYEDKADYPLG